MSAFEFDKDFFSEEELKMNNFKPEKSGLEITLEDAISSKEHFLSQIEKGNPLYEIITRELKGLRSSLEEARSLRLNKNK